MNPPEKILVLIFLLSVFPGFPPICNVADFFFLSYFLVSWDSTVMMILKCLALSKTEPFIVLVRQKKSSRSKPSICVTRSALVYLAKHQADL